MRLAFVLSILLGVAVACGGAADNDGGDTEGRFATATITLVDGAGQRTELTVEIARTPAQLSRGLMFRKELPEERGMIFVFESETKAGFWMKDTKIPLSIAFIANDGTIMETQEMKPLSADLHVPARPYRYALEVSQGWFERHDLGFGDRVEIPADVKPE